MKIKFAVRSETGYVRTNNEDNFFCNGVFMASSGNIFLKGIVETSCIFAVCDGMGGEALGDFSALTTVALLAEYADEIQNGLVNEFIKEINRKLHVLGVSTGTTLAMVVIKEDSFIAYNLGYSRIYRKENGRLLRITDDHTVAEDKVRMGILTPKQAERSRERNILTRYVGMPYDDFMSFPDAYGPYKFDGKILLCSDGLTDMLSYREISEIVSRSDDSVYELTEAALKKGGNDNITCLMINST